MNLSELKTALTSRFDTLVASPESLLTQYDNMKIDTNDIDLWCRFSIITGLNFQASIGDPGANRFRRLGNAVASLFMRLNGGDAEVDALAVKIEAAFRSVTLVNGLTLLTPETVLVGNTGDGYWQTNVFCPFQANDLQ